MQIQLDLGSDMIMAFDECTPFPATREYAKNSLEITTRWAARCKKYFLAKTARMKTKHFLFGIIQGSTFKDYREESAGQIVGLDTDGVAIGGVSVGEPPEKMLQVLDWVGPYLPEEKPHYLMGVGYPDQIVESVKRGIDMFDCVIPTRNGRHGELFVFSASGRTKNASVFRNKKFYSSIHITNKKFTADFGPVDKTCKCYTCRNFSRAYMRHLFMVKENLGLRLATIHNLAFYLELMKRIREEI
jgi:queuine tRNA-ribosyltransferase